MFNGYHETAVTSYTDTSADKGKKTANACKWPYGNGANVVHSQSVSHLHLHPQPHQAEIWPGTKASPFAGASDSINPPSKCNCSNCYQLQESQSYQGDVAWHAMSWLARTYPPVPVNASTSSSATTHDLVKLQSGNQHHHHWDGTQGVESFTPESVASQYTQEANDRALLYKQYPALARHGDAYQTAGIPMNAKVSQTRKEEAKLESAMVSNGAGDHRNARFPTPNAATEYPSMDRRRFEDIGGYCAQQGNMAQYHVNPNVARRTILENYPKPVPSSNQNRVPSTGHRCNAKESVLHQYTADQIAKLNPYIEEKLPRMDPARENLQINPEYHGYHSRDYSLNVLDRDFQKFAIGRDYYARNNLGESVKKNIQNWNTMDGRKEYGLQRKGVITPSMKHPPDVGIQYKETSYGKLSTELKLLASHKDDSYTRCDGGVDSIRRPQLQPNCLVPPQQDSRPEYMYSAPRGNVKGMYEYGLKNDVPTSQEPAGMYQTEDQRNGLDACWRFNEYQFDKFRYSTPTDTKQQNFARAATMPHSIPQPVYQEKDKAEKISHLESIRQEDLNNKNGTTKISPLRLLRKKKFLQHTGKELSSEVTPPPAATAVDVKNSTPPLDVRRFWATWADEEEENLPQTQMVVLDCHNIDPGLIHLYNSDPVRTVQTADGNSSHKTADNMPSDDQKQLNTSPMRLELLLGMPVIETEGTEEDSARAPSIIKDGPKTIEEATETPIIEERVDSSVKLDNVSHDAGVTSETSDESQTGDLPSIPDLPTSEYRKNKFLDYDETATCHTTFPHVGSDVQETAHMKKLNAPHDRPIADPTVIPDIPPCGSDIEDILRKLSDINVQSPDTDLKAPEQKRDKRVNRKLCHKSSRTDEVNLSLAKPTIKFSIQKSHDLKISFKVLNNKEFKGEENSDDGCCDEGTEQEDSSEEGVGEDEKKNGQRLITLKLKGVTEELDKDRDEDFGRRVRKKKKVKSRRSTSPKTPVLKIKKSRYMQSGEVSSSCEAREDVTGSFPNPGDEHGDFQVRETTVDSAKIRLTFKRNKSGEVTGKRLANEEEDTPDDVTMSLEMASTPEMVMTDPCLNEIIDSGGEPIDCYGTISADKGAKEESNDDTFVVDSTVKEDDNLVPSPPFVPDLDYSDSDIISPSPIKVVHLNDDTADEVVETQVDPLSDVPCHIPETSPADRKDGETDNGTDDITFGDGGDTRKTVPKENAETCDLLEKDGVATSSVAEMQNSCVDGEPNAECENILSQEQEKEEVRAGVAMQKESDDTADDEGKGSEERTLDSEQQRIESNNLTSLELVDDKNTCEEITIGDAEEQSPMKTNDVIEESIEGDIEEKMKDETKEEKLNAVELELEDHSGVSNIDGPKESQVLDDERKGLVTVYEEKMAREKCNRDEEVHVCSALEELSDEQPEVSLPTWNKSHSSDEIEGVALDGVCHVGETPGGVVHIVEENNNVIDVKILPSFVTRKIQRRASCEDIRERSQTKTIRGRSESVHVDLPCNVGVRTVNDLIDVGDIPLPPGDAPPQNCFDFVKYFESLRKNTESPGDENSKTSITTEKTPELRDDRMDGTFEKSCEPISKLNVEDNCSTGIMEAVKDSDSASDEDKAFLREQICECEGLSFSVSEDLEIPDDMVDGKVSDDDKFRDIMQNCLENATKFLGSVKTFAGDDELARPDESEDVIPTTCEESGNEDFVSNHSIIDVSVEFGPSFCSDAACSEILPVDNWPYLEEEVASSPLRTDPDEQDISSSCNADADGGATGRKRSRRVSVPTETPSRNEPTQRRRTIEGGATVFEGDVARAGKELSTARKRHPKSEDDGSNEPTDKRLREYEKSSWQPRVLLFRISKTVDDATERSGANNSTRIREMFNKRKKKSRFRNLHTKRRKDDDTDSESEDSDEKPVNEPCPMSKGDVTSKSTKIKERSPDEGRESRRSTGEDDDKKWKKEKDDDDKRKARRRMSRWEKRRDSEGCWSCEVCGFNKWREREKHVRSHPFHCQSCHLAFKTETTFLHHLTRKHKDIRNQHHCLLCELSFDQESDYHRHLETREHTHLESVEKNTINTLFTLLTGGPCPVLGTVPSKPQWLPSQAGTVHFYHRATPLSLALQYLELHRGKKDSVLSSSSLPVSSQKE